MCARGACWSDDDDWAFMAENEGTVVPAAVAVSTLTATDAADAAASAAVAAVAGEGAAADEDWSMEMTVASAVGGNGLPCASAEG